MHIPFPAILIGGPPNSGKSLLTYNLTQALRARQTAHFVIRAAPDGEGDWSHQIDRTLVQELRYPGQWNPEFVTHITAAIQRRHYPLLVDAGGKPKPWQETIFQACTHAVLLIGKNQEQPTVHQQHLATWRAIMRRNHVPIIAELFSDSTTVSTATTRTPILQGVLGKITPGEMDGDVVFVALLRLLQSIFAFSRPALTAGNFATAPTQVVMDLEMWPPPAETGIRFWKPEMLPAFLATIPPHAPRSLYGRAPNWAVTAAALRGMPASLFLFDPRYGWIAPPALTLHPRHDFPPPAACQRGWSVASQMDGSTWLIEMGRDSQYLDLYQPQRLPLPQMPASSNILLSGSLPQWLLVGAAHRYAPHSRWLAVYQPPLSGAVIVHSSDPAYPVGTLLREPDLPCLSAGD